MRRRRIYEGKAKVLFEGPQPGTLVQYFKDDASADNNRKQGVITGKGVLNNRISEYLMVRLAEIGVPTHFMRRLNMREQLVRELEIIPIEVAVRNVAAGSFCTRFGLEEGAPLLAIVVGAGIALPARPSQFGQQPVQPVWLFAPDRPDIAEYQIINIIS